MDAQTTVSRIARLQIDAPAFAKLGRVIATCWLAVLGACAILICARRAGGALVEPLSPGMLLAVGVFLALTAIVFRASLAASSRFSNRPSTWLAMSAPTCVLALWLVGLSSGAPATGLVALWGTLLLQEAWSWRRIKKVSGTVSGVKTASAEKRFLTPFSASPLSAPGALADCEVETDEAISQQFVRRRQPDGSESIEGWLRAHVAAGQRHATAHLAICPPLDGACECFAEQTDGPPAKIRVAQALPFGVRLEIKLDEPAQQADRVTAEFSIQSQSTASN